jgi:hypothetical protein
MDEGTRRYVVKLEDENVRLRNALEELSGATRGYLGLRRMDGKTATGSARLVAALEDASRALHSS